MQELREEEFSKQFDAILWKDLAGYLFPYKKIVIGLMGIMILVGVLDAVFPYLTKYAVDNFVVTDSAEGIGSYALIYGIIVTLQSLNILLMIMLAGKLQTGFSYDLRKVGFNHLQELSLSYYDKTAVGWLMARMTSDVRSLGEVISWGIVDLVWGLTMMIASIVFMLAINWKLALVTMTVVPFLVMISFYFQKKLLKVYRLVRKINSRITGAFNEGIMGARTSKTLVREDDNLNEFKGITKEMEDSSVRAAIYSSLYRPIAISLGSIGMALVVWYGGGGVALETIQYGTLVAFFGYAVMFFEPVNHLAYIFAQMQSAQAAAERTMSMINTEIEIHDTPEIKKKYGDSLHPRKENWPSLKGDITFQHVSFAYKGGEKVLKDFNLDVKAGQKIALVGETGSGKSTIVNLVGRFYEPTAGRILIDGVDYRERSLHWLQSNLGYVLQSPHLFSGSIMENIRYGNLEAGDEEVREAAKKVKAHDFIVKLEQGYQTEVGERGDKLSTGQKQLISFARAILTDPRIFILDEATSSIDTEMEKIIQEAIYRMMEGRTSFMIAHRLSTIRSADRILVIREGRIVEEGNHQQLIRKRGYYYQLHSQ